MAASQYHWYLFMALTSLACSNAVRECDKVYFNGTSLACRCNETYCDTVEANNPLPSRYVARYTTSFAGDRLRKTVEIFVSSENYTNENVATTVLKIDRSKVYQTIIGFGGAITDSAGLNIMTHLKPGARDLLLRSYYAPEGIEYTMGRIPIASCDFSPRVYSYDDVDGDFDLEHFSLQPEDLEYKIPVILKAMNISRRKILYYGSPWSAPGWMKNTGFTFGPGILKGKAGDRYHKTYANYYVKFIESYKAHGIPIWGLTVENEPTVGFLEGPTIQSMGYTPTMEHDFVAKDLGPALNASENGHVALMILDDSRDLLPDSADRSLATEEASKYVSGIAFHWYADMGTSPEILTVTHNHHPDKFILSTEACYLSAPLIGDWDRGSGYAKDILLNLQNWLSGFVDWNMALNLKGGPKWNGGNGLDTPILINTTNNEFYKQPMFYAMGHFSKFLPKGSQRIGVNVVKSSMSDAKVTELLYCAFSVLEDGSTVLIMLNEGDNDLPLNIVDEKVGTLSTVAFKKSITTFVWWA